MAPNGARRQKTDHPSIPTTSTELAADPGLAAKLYALADEAGTLIRHILYDSTCLAQPEVWLKNKTVPSHMSDVILLLGQYIPPILAGADMLNQFSAVTGDNKYRWTAYAFGQHESDCLLAAAKLGGDVRIGFENNFQCADGSLASSNENQVAEFVGAVAASGISEGSQRLICTTPPAMQLPDCPNDAPCDDQKSACLVRQFQRSNRALP